MRDIPDRLSWRVARQRIVMVLALSFLLSACETVSPFSPRAYEIATSLKAEALVLMDRASEPADKHAAAIHALQLDLAKAYEFAKGRPRNEDATRQWAIIRDPERNSLGGFLRRWKAQQKLSPAFIAEAKALVADGFDQVIELESGKRRPN
jgi:hypothetical protein